MSESVCVFPVHVCFVCSQTMGDISTHTHTHTHTCIHVHVLCSLPPSNCAMHGGERLALASVKFCLPLCAMEGGERLGLASVGFL